MDTEKIIVAVIIILTFGVFGFIAFTSFKTSESQNIPLDTKLILGDARNFKGESVDNAKTILVEFSDFECPSCASISPIVKGIKEKYPELTFVYRQFPLSIHRNAKMASIASEAAALQGKFWEYHDELFFSSPNLSRADLESYAVKVGLDVEKFKADLGSQSLADLVNADLSDGNQLGVRGTPTFYLIHEGVATEIKMTSLSTLEDAIAEKLGKR